MAGKIEFQLLRNREWLGAKDAGEVLPAGWKAAKKARCLVTVGRHALLHKPRVLCVGRAGHRRVHPIELRCFGGSEKLFREFLAPVTAIRSQRLAALCRAFL